MKTSIRSKKFTTGMVVFLTIILLLAVSSAYFMNKLLKKTNTILKENHYSVVYARDMADFLTNTNEEIVSSFLSNKDPDSVAVNRDFILFDQSLESEKKNITEPGENEIVSGIETDYKEYRNMAAGLVKSQGLIKQLLLLETRFDSLYRKLILLSQINETAIETKTDDVKIFSKKATLQMTGIGTLCFLVAYGYTFIFSSYFSERFRILYKGIKNLESSDYNEKLYVEGNDELTEIAVIFNEMIEALRKNKPAE